jgi:hypothetical protein
MIGYIKLNRKILDWEWYSDCVVKSLFIHCLIEANHAPKTWRGIEIERGQFITSIETLKTKTGISNQSLRTALNKLKLTGEISIKSTNRFTLITVINYDTYQGKDEETNKPANKQLTRQLTNNQQTTNKQLTTTKNDKNKKNEENKRKEASPVFDIESLLASHLNTPECVQAIEEWLRHKKEIKDTYKQTGFNALMKKLNKEYETPDELIHHIEHSISNGWKGIHPDQNYVPIKKDLEPCLINGEPSKYVFLTPSEKEEIASRVENRFPEVAPMKLPYLLNHLVSRVESYAFAKKIKPSDGFDACIKHIEFLKYDLNAVLQIQPPPTKELNNA